MLERMDLFFDSRVDEYDRHQLTCIDSAPEFYRYTAEQLPMTAACEILDLGCGTGLELSPYYARNPSARITGIDLAPGMLQRLSEKYPDKTPTLILGSYFDVPFGISAFDAVVSVESLHHYSASEKAPLYRKILAALKADGFFLLTDFFSQSDEEEQQYAAALQKLKTEQGASGSELFHYDTPLTVEHEKQALLAAGFACVKVLKTWGATSALLAKA